MSLKRSTIAIKCPYCASDFFPRRLPKGALQKFCSHSCALRFHSPPERNAEISRVTADARGDAQRDRGDGKTYRKLRGRHEHRVVAENKLNRKLLKGEIVHHKDGDKRNNAPDNLEILSGQADHMRAHGLAIPGNPPPNSVFLSALGETHTVSEWAKIRGLSKSGLWGRLRCGVDAVTALTTPSIRSQQNRKSSL